MKKNLTALFLLAAILLPAILGCIPTSAAGTADYDTLFDSSTITILTHPHEFNVSLGVANVFDKNADWNSRWCDQMTGQPSFFTFCFPETVHITKMVMDSGNRNSNQEAPLWYSLQALRDESQMDLLGSEAEKEAFLNEASNWMTVVEVDNRNHDGSNSPNRVETVVDSVRPSRYYRFDVRKGNSLSDSGGWVNVSELYFYGYTKALVNPTKVTFDTNGGQGRAEERIVEQGDTLVLPECRFTAPENFTFGGWMLDDGRILAPGSKLVVEHPMTVKAHWVHLEMVEVNFYPNGGSGSMEFQSIRTGDFCLPACTFTPPFEYHFAGWRMPDGTVKKAGEHVTLERYTRLDAMWSKSALATVAFTCTAGAVGDMKDIRVPVGGTVQLPASAFRTDGNYVFKGWEVGGTLRQPGETITVTADMMVNARYEINDNIVITVHLNGGIYFNGKLVSTCPRSDEQTWVNVCVRAPIGKKLTGFWVNGEIKPDLGGSPGYVIPNRDLHVVPLFESVRPEAAPSSGQLVSGNQVEILDYSKFCDARMIFDGNSLTSWRIVMHYDNSPFITFRLPEKYQLNEFTVYPLVEPGKNHAPHAYELQVLKDESAYRTASDPRAFLKDDNNWKPIFSYDSTAAEPAEVHRNTISTSYAPTDLYRFRVTKDENGSTTGEFSIKDMVLYGTPSDPSVPDVHFDTGLPDGEAVVDMPDVPVRAGESFILPDCPFVPKAPDLKFSHWLVNGEKKVPGDGISVSTDTTVTAVWRKAADIMYLDENGAEHHIKEQNVRIITSTTRNIDDAEWWYVPAGETVIIPGGLETIKSNFPATRLILGNGARLEVQNILCGPNANLYIYAQSRDPLVMGTLKADASEFTQFSAIGGRDGMVTGHMYFCGGHIQASSSDTAYAIGGNKADMTVFNGLIECNSFSYGPYWGGMGGDSSTIRIYGGTVSNLPMQGDKSPELIGGHNASLIIGPDAGITEPEHIGNTVKVTYTVLVPSDAFVSEDRPEPVLKLNGVLPDDVTLEYALNPALDGYSPSIPTVSKGGVYEVHVRATIGGIVHEDYVYQLMVKGNNTITPDTVEWISGIWIADGAITIADRIEIMGDVVLRLNSGCELRALLGIHVPKGSSLTIEGDGTDTGRLVATQMHDGINRNELLFRVNLQNSVIGSNSTESAPDDPTVNSCGDITIRGGTVLATVYGEPGKQDICNGSAIGCGSRNYDQTITITGGHVVADARGSHGAAIGSGMCDLSNADQSGAGHIVISGGFVEAYGQHGIGGGQNSLDGSFRTGRNGTAHILTDRIGDKSEPFNWSGLISEDGGRQYMIYAQGETAFTLPAYRGTVHAGQVFRGWAIGGDSAHIGQVGETATVAVSTVLVPVFDESQDVVGHSLSISDRIGVNFFIRLGYDFPLDTVIRFTLPEGKVLNLSVYDGESRHDGVFRFTVPMVAKRMIDKIHAEVIHADTVLFEEDYAVEDYARVIMANKDGIYDEKTREIVRTMLNYGAAAQVQFGYRTDLPANRWLTPEQQKVAPGMAFDSFVFTEPDAAQVQAVGGISYEASALILESTTGIKHYFKLTEGAKIGDYRFELLKDGYVEQVLKPFVELNMFCVQVPEIYAYNLDKSYTVRVTRGENSFELVYSPYTYGHFVMEIPTGYESLKQVMFSMNEYCVAAKNYI